MKLIAHRGNINGPNLEKENNPKYIEDALNLGYDVELDIRYIDNKFYLGHDEPQYNVSLNWLTELKENFWIHCKNLKSLEFFTNSSFNFNYFWHQEDDYTLTSKNYIWTYPGKPYGEMSIIVMPELNNSIDRLIEIKDYKCMGICSDYIGVL
jgi:hypothetical protein